MGGKNPVVVLEDANLDRAVELTVQGAMKSAGEKCTATARAIVVESVADEFTRRLVARVLQLEVGPGTDGKYYLGPMISLPARAKVLTHLEGAHQRRDRRGRAAGPVWRNEGLILLFTGTRTGR